MKTGIQAAILAVAAVVATFNVAAEGSKDGARDRKHRDYVAHLQGSWSGDISIRDCASGNLLAGPFAGLTTFHQGGTLSETRAGNPNSPRGPGHGVWHRTGRHEFMIKIVFQRFDLNGLLIGTQEIVSLNEVSEDSSSAVVTATFKVLDLNGVTLASGCASGESSRIHL
jgi:hypothetical protein